MTKRIFSLLLAGICFFSCKQEVHKALLIKELKSDLVKYVFDYTPDGTLSQVDAWYDFNEEGMSQLPTLKYRFRQVPDSALIYCEAFLLDREDSASQYTKWELLQFFQDDTGRINKVIRFHYAIRDLPYPFEDTINIFYDKEGIVSAVASSRNKSGKQWDIADGNLVIRPVQKKKLDAFYGNI